MRSNAILSMLLALVLWIPVTLQGSHPSETMNTEFENNDETMKDHLLVVWTSADPEVAHLMTFMYTRAAKKNGWWKEVTLLIWGPSAKLASSDKEIQESLKEMKEAGVELIACKACADKCEVSPELVQLGIDVRYTGTYLTEFIKSGKKVITF